MNLEPKAIPVPNARGFLYGAKRATTRTVASIMAGRDEQLKDAVCDVLANSAKVWEYSDFTAAVDALERCNMPLADWLLTV